MSQPKIAIAHDYLTQRGGAERVVLALQRAFPAAPIHTTLYSPEQTYPEFKPLEVTTTWLNRIRVFRRFHRLALPFLPLAVGSNKIFADYTIVSSSGWAHGFRTSGLKIVFCHSPARWLYESEQYLGRRRLSLKRLAVLLLSPALKKWDKRNALTAAKYFAVSTVVQKRIERAYGIDAEVLPPPHSIDTSLPVEPVDISFFESEKFYLCVSRLLPYKNVDVAIKAAKIGGFSLVVVGVGPDERRLRQLAEGGVLMVRDLTDAQMRWLYCHCRAVVAASYEDFGLTPIEGAAYGKPSVVLRSGGFLDTVLDGRTGVFFDNPDALEISEAMRSCQEISWDSAYIEAHARNFAEEKFAARLAAEIVKMDLISKQAQ